MSTVMLLLCHPNPKSYNHAVAAEVRSRLEEQSHSVLVHDLYAEGFDPVLRHDELRRRFSFDELVQRHYRDLESSDGLVVVHPEWWSQPPAMLKGWIDRVLRPGIGYEFEGEEFMPKSKVPLLTDKRAVVLATTDSERPVIADGASSSEDPLLSHLWRETFRFCGIQDFHFRMLYDIRNLAPSDRREWIESSADYVGELFEAATPPQ